MKFSRPKRQALLQRGDSFVEVMIGAALVLIMAIGLYGVMNTGVDAIRSARENLRATQIMENRLEGLRLYTWSQVTDPSLFPTNFTAYFYPDATNAATGGIVYTGAVTVAGAPLSPPATYSNSMYQVTVKLDWVSRRVLHTRQMSTYYAKHGVQNYLIQN